MERFFMSTSRESATTKKDKKPNIIKWLIGILCLLTIVVIAVKCSPKDTTEAAEGKPSEQSKQWETGYIAAIDSDVEYFDETDAPLGTLLRGTQVEYKTTPEGQRQVRLDGTLIYLPPEAQVVSEESQIIPAHTLYVRTAVNLRDTEGKLLEAFADKGDHVEVIGYDYLQEDGTAHMYHVKCGDQEGYIMPWYVVSDEVEALLSYDGGDYNTHLHRENRYGGGGAAELDYYPREKGPIEGNVMPEECRTLYMVAESVSNVDAYIEIAQRSDINAFVVDITDGGAIGYASDVMKEYCPTAAASAGHSVEEYKAAIQKLKDAGYYVIGRITTFNDSLFTMDHPECAITDQDGKALVLSGAHWPTAFNRYAWQYKVDLAVEAVELMGFHEIQFDYVRFPDRTTTYEAEGKIDFHNTYGETKAQAIQRFLMYATDIVHEHGAYVSADVFGESAYNYVTAYGQYWPAISNVVDAISGMPYPDHFSQSGNWRPWLYPYDTLKSWGEDVMDRQSETATPAVVRTWIQAYDAIKSPFNTYGPKEISAQIRGLWDAGCTGGYMTWNGSASLEKYTSLIPAFKPSSES